VQVELAINSDERLDVALIDGLLHVTDHLLKLLKVVVGQMRHGMSDGLALDQAAREVQIVHIAVRTLRGLRGRGYAPYCAAKGGLGTMCRQLAAELAPHRINVNVVAPTFVRTEQVAAMLADPQFYEALTARIPLGRVAEPEEVMHAVLFFASRASDFITGQTLYLDGGITATQ
jgi:NAD(P)-dependent dehydrogenase (short-subunit alcohol dehydrogenase family)